MRISMTSLTEIAPWEYPSPKPITMADLDVMLEEIASMPRLPPVVYVTPEEYAILQKRCLVGFDDQLIPPNDTLLGTPLVVDAVLAREQRQLPLTAEEVVPFLRRLVEINKETA